MAHMRSHASRHTDGTDDIQDATDSVKGLATSTQIGKLDGVDENADVTGSNAPQGHASSHENGNGDEISVAALSGVLADKQDADKLQGRVITTSTPNDDDIYRWNDTASEWQPESLDTAIKSYIQGGQAGQQQYFLVAGVNLKTIAQTELLTVPAGYRLIVYTAEIVIDTITGAAGMPTVRFGVDGDEGAFVGAREIDPTMNEVNAFQGWDCPQDAIAAAGVIEFGVTVAGTSTTHTGTVLVTGRLLEA